MIAKDENLFVVMDALNQVSRGRRTEKLYSHLHDVQVELQQIFVTRINGLNTYL